jgi:hypothetical protein
MAFGRTAPIDDPVLKRRLMNAFIDRLFPGRSRELRPMHEAELAAISVIAMTIEEASAKGRDDGPQDVAEDLSVPCWAGVIPIRTTLGRAIPDPRLAGDPALPPNLAPYAEHARLDDLLIAAARDAERAVECIAPDEQRTSS